MARHGRRGGGGEGEGAERSYRDLSWVCNTIESHSNYICTIMERFSGRENC